MFIIGKSAQLLLQVTFHILFWSVGWTHPWAFQFIVNQCYGSVEIVGIHKQTPICHPEDIAGFFVTMFVNALRKAISTFSISLKRNNRNFLSKRYGLSASWKELSALSCIDEPPWASAAWDTDRSQACNCRCFGYNAPSVGSP